jgi:multiple antibiotic resistance protein
LAFPSIITPYGTAALIPMRAAAGGSRDHSILGIFLAVMVLNLVAMWFAPFILKYGAGLVQVLGAVLGVLQVALAIQMLLLAGRLLGCPASVSDWVVSEFSVQSMLLEELHASS